MKKKPGPDPGKGQKDSHLQADAAASNTEKGNDSTGRTALPDACWPGATMQLCYHYAFVQLHRHKDAHSHHLSRICPDCRGP